MFVTLKKDFLGHKAGTKIDLSEVDAKALMDNGTAEAVKDDPLQDVIAKAMTTTMEGITGGLNKAVETALQQFAAASTKSRRGAVPAIFGEGNQGDPKKTFGSFMLAVQRRDLKALEEMGSRFVEWTAEELEQKAALNSQTGTQGGFLVPTEMHDQLMQLVSEMSLIRPKATIVPMRGREVEVPALDHTTAPSAGNSAFLGGVVARWTEEATTVGETEPTLRQVRLTNYELSGYSKVSNTLLADSAVGLEALLKQIFARAIAWYEDYAFLRGSGANQPLGILTWAGLISVTRSAASAIALADVAGMYGRWLPPAGLKNALWGIHPTGLVKLLTMTGGDNVLFLGNDINGNPTWQILGIPVMVSEKLPSLNTAGDILLMDLAHYLIGDRQQIEIAYSEHVAFLTNQSVWRFVSRVAGRPWLNDKITLSDASSTLSPFIALAAG